MCCLPDLLPRRRPDLIQHFGHNGWLARYPYRRFAPTLTGRSARLGADVDRYSFITVDFHYVSSWWFASAQQVAEKPRFFRKRIPSVIFQ
jgi:hypothetical protein